MAFEIWKSVQWFGRSQGGGGLWTKHHILLGPRCYFTSDPPLVELSPCSKDGQSEGEAAVIAHQPISQGIEPGTTESVDREQSPEPPAPPGGGPLLPPPPQQDVLLTRPQRGEG